MSVSSALDSLISGSETSSTTMPSWYDTAQQNIVNSASQAAGAIPTLQNTVAGQAISNLSGPSNPFTTAQSNLTSLASANANPWLISPTGTVTPNTATPLGGLFAAQNQELNTLIPQITAAPTAGAISQGQFGSLRNLTAADTALANAQAQMLPQQLQTALNAQTQAIEANRQLANTGTAGTSAATTLGQLQQADPFTASKDLAQILGTIKAPMTTTLQTQLPLSQQIMGIQGVLGQGGDILRNLGIGSGSGGILNMIGNLLGTFNTGTGGGGGSSPTSPGGIGLDSFGTDVIGGDIISGLPGTDLFGS